MFPMPQHVFSCENIRESAYRVVLALLLMFVSAPLCSQITVSGGSAGGSPLGKSFLATRTPLGKERPVLKIITHETSVQEHEGTEVYREVRDVEYTVRAKKENYIIKRKVLKKEKTTVGDAALAEKFIDMTSDLQTTFLRPRKVKERKPLGKTMSAVGKVTVEDSVTNVLIDLMASAKDEYTDKKGRVVLANFFGNITEMTGYVETLCYRSLSDKLYIDDLKAVNTVFGCNNIKKNGETLRMRNIENIEIVSVGY